MHDAINRLRRWVGALTNHITMSRAPATSKVTAAKAAEAASITRTAYLVLGMHRSGTSAITQVLALAGTSLPAHVMPGDEHNAKGYFEPWKIAIFNDQRLRAGGSAWDDIFAYPYRALPPALEADWHVRAGKLFDAEFRRSVWPLMKDPRATVLLPFWRAVLAERHIGIRCVIPVRHPLAVASSLSRRDGFSPEKSVLVWSAYMLAAEAYTRDLPRAFLSYDALLSDWRGEVARLEIAHGAPLPRLTAAAGRKIDAFLTRDLRHNVEDGDFSALGWAGELASGVYDWFAATAAGDRPNRRALDEAAAELARREHEFGVLVSPAARDLAGTRADLLATRQQLVRASAFQDELRAEVARLESGWRADQTQIGKLLSEAERIQAEIERLGSGWRADQAQLGEAFSLLREINAQFADE